MRIMQLATYPSRTPRHGGQVRVANIRAVLEAAGHETRAFSVYEPESYGGDGVEAHDIVFPSTARQRILAPTYCTDYAAGDFLAEDTTAYEHLVAFVTRFLPAVITLEQPWLWPAVARLRGDARVPPFKLVYSSQNIEAPLKRGIVADLVGDQVDAIVHAIELRQRDAARSADLVIACTEADAAVLLGFGARNVVVAGNGAAARTVDEKVLRDWRGHFGSKRLALFVGSGHPPNMIGFWEMLGPSLAFLAPDHRILVVGGVSDHLHRFGCYSNWPAINDSRLDRAGQQPDDVLAAFYALARCVILPITRGGGSNIKTPEAVLAGKPVVGTSKSLRGHEHALALPNVYCTDVPREFRSLVKAALDGQLGPPAPHESAVVSSMLWSATLSALPAAFAALSPAASEAPRAV